MTAPSSASPRPLGRIATAMITPFTEDGALDLDGAQRVADHLVTTGTQMLVVHGTTGESPTLADDEPWQLLGAVLDAVGDRAVVMMGTGSNDTAHAIASTSRATEMGADAVLVVTPYYNRPDQRGLIDHFGRVAAATDLPVVLYDVPHRTGTEIAVETLAELAAIDHIVGVKDASGSGSKVGDILNATAGAPGGFAIWSGADELNLAILATGGYGIISVAAHLVGPQLAEMVACVASDPARAAAIHRACLPLHRALFAEPSPAPVKAAMAARGLPAGHVRPPLLDASPETTAAVLAALDAVATTLDRRGTVPTGATA